MLLLLIAMRFLHLGEAIDDPHSWRQTETAQYIRAFQEEGIDLLRPSVCWMGNHKTVIFEFPLPEAIVAVAQHIFGPSILVARLVFLAFFLLSAWYLFVLVKWLWDHLTAQYALLVYLCLPLGIYYSRAVHIDFFALSLGLGGVYFMLKGLDQNRWPLMAVSTAMLTVSFLVKAPYLFYFALPILFYIGRNGLWKRLLRFSPILLIPVIAFLLWRRHVGIVNGQMPDWSFLPGYFKLTNMSWWYFGNLDMRFDSYRWSVILTRFSGEMAGIVGIGLAAIGLFVPSAPGNRTRFFGMCWAIGLVAYLLLFFPLNIIHNYYQIPFLPLVALLIGSTLRALHQRLARHAWGPWAVALLLLLVVAENAYRAEYQTYQHSSAKYFSVHERYEAAGQFIDAELPKDALIIISDPAQDPRNPSWLYRCHRYGWPVHSGRLTPEIVKRLQEEGATHLALLYQQEVPENLRDWFAGQASEKHKIGEWELGIVEINERMSE